MLLRDEREEIFEEILRCSSYVELQGGWFLDREGREKIKPLVEEKRVLSVHLPMGKDSDISNPETKNKAIQTIKKILEGVPQEKLNLILHPGEVLREGEKEEERISLSISSIKEILSFVEGSPWRIALENMPPHYVGSSVDAFRFLFEELDTSKIGMCLDTGHGNLTGNLLHLIKSFSGRILSIHLHDNDGSGDKHLQVPYGTIKWEKIIPYIGGKNIILESFPWGGADIFWMLKEVNAFFEGRIVKQDRFYLRCSRCKHFLFEENGERVCYCKKSGETYPR